MKLSDLFEAKKPKYVYHLTGVRQTVAMLKNKRLYLSKEKGYDDFFFSVATSVKSGYFSFMAGPDSVMMVINAPALYAGNKVVPYRNDDGAKELNLAGVHSEEFEDRLVGTTDHLPIDPSNVFKEIRVMRTKERIGPKGSFHFNEDDFEELKQLCASYDIPLNVVTSKPALRKAAV